MSKILNAQIRFGISKAGLQSARNIIFHKIRNSYHLLQQYEASARRSGNAMEKIIKDCRIDIYRELERVLKAETRQKIMLCEARAGRRYWHAVGLICKQEKYWTRTQRRPDDVLNKALNIGYHFLCTECEKMLKETGLFLDIGFLHSNNLKSPLAYDFMEQFRQPFVDKVIIPLFSRKRNIDEEHIAKIVVFLCIKKLPMSKLRKEARNLKQALIGECPYVPQSFLWGHI